MFLAYTFRTFPHIMVRIVKCVVSGKVIDDEELVNLMDASLDFWLTSGRYAQRFEQEFARWMERPSDILTKSGSSANLLALSYKTFGKEDAG